MSRYCDIHQCIRQTLERYFEDLDGEAPAAVYDMVLRNVERPMLEVIMQQAGGNQTQAAQLLGINRNTLRRKLAEHGMI